MVWPCNKQDPLEGLLAQRCSTSSLTPQQGQSQAGGHRRTLTVIIIENILRRTRVNHSWFTHQSPELKEVCDDCREGKGYHSQSTEPSGFLWEMNMRVADGHIPGQSGLDHCEYQHSKDDSNVNCISLIMNTCKTSHSGSFFCLYYPSFSFYCNAISLS